VGTKYMMGYKILNVHFCLIWSPQAYKLYAKTPAVTLCVFDTRITAAG